MGAQFISNLGPEWTKSYHSKEGFQVSEKGLEKGARGRKEQGDCAMYIVIVGEFYVLPQRKMQKSLKYTKLHGVLGMKT